MTKNKKGILRSILFIFLLVFLVIILDFFTGKNVYDSSVWNKIQSKDTVYYDENVPLFRKNGFFRKYPFSAFKHCHAYSIIIVVFLQEIIR